MYVWDFYEDNYATREMSYKNDGERIKFILDNIPDTGAKILDIGCGPGELSVKMRKNGNEVWGIDMCKASVNKARERGITALHGDILGLGITTTFDIVCCNEVIEHVFYVNQVLMKILRLLKPGGKLILTTPNTAALGRRLMLLCGISPHLECCEDKTAAGHLRYFVQKDMINLLTDNHFKILKTTSDEVNFCASGKIKSRLLAKIYPRLGRSILIVAEK